MNEIMRAFSYGEKPVRVFEQDGQTWFVAKDVCDVLGLTNSRKSVEGLDDDQKGVTNSDTLGGSQNLTTINEPGLYALVFKSRKPEAKAFQRWVTNEVLPALRQTGTYSIHRVENPLLVENERLLAQMNQAMQVMGMVIQKVTEHDSRIVAVEDRVNQIQAAMIEAQTQELQDPTEEVPGTIRDEVRIVVNSIARLTGKGQQEVYRSIYASFEQRMHIRLSARTKNKSTLEFIEESGHMGKLYAIAKGMYDRAVRLSAS